MNLSIALANEIQRHHESRFTRLRVLVATQFGFQKRRAHFSSLIVTG
jgi:hypothetical protein